MSQSKLPHNPGYRLHKPSGQAVVTLCGRDFYLGAHGTETSKREYDRLVAEWLANGRRLPRVAVDEIKVVELIDRFLAHAKTYYVKDGCPTGEQDSIRQALRPVNRLYGDVDVSAFGPSALRAVQQAMIGLGWCRRQVNQQISRVRLMFKWGVAMELVPPSVYGALRTVDGLKRGRTTTPDPEPVRPVPEAVVEATLAAMRNTRISAMVRLQSLTGMRPGEVVIMRGCDLDTTGALWEYRPAHHKTEHHDKTRIIMLGAQAQAVVRPFLRPNLQEYLFQPREALEEHMAQRRAARKKARTYYRRVRRPNRTVGDHYRVETYREVVERWAKKAGVEHWHPSQLRHNWATKIRKLFGLEAARVTLGHSSAETTLIYAERDMGLYRKVAAEVG